MLQGGRRRQRKNEGIISIHLSHRPSLLYSFGLALLSLTSNWMYFSIKHHSQHSGRTPKRKHLFLVLPPCPLATVTLRPLSSVSGPVHTHVQEKNNSNRGQGSVIWKIGWSGTEMQYHFATKNLTPPTGKTDVSEMDRVPFLNLTPTGLYIHSLLFPSLLPTGVEWKKQRKMEQKHLYMNAWHEMNKVRTEL